MCKSFLVLPLRQALSDPLSQALYPRDVCLYLRSSSPIDRTASTCSTTSSSLVLEIHTAWLKKSTRCSEFKKKLSQKSYDLRPLGTTASLPGKMSFHFTRPENTTRTKFTSPPFMQTVSTPESLLRDLTSGKPIMQRLQNLSAGSTIFRSFPMNHSCRSN